LLGSMGRLRARYNDHINFEGDKFGSEAGQPIRSITGSIHDDDVPSFDIAQIGESLFHSFEATFVTKKAYASDAVELLRPRCNRPRRCTAKQGDETAPFHLLAPKRTARMFACLVGFA
jgi:hypothetical protein